MSEYTHGRTSVYNINYHIIWCVKYRRKVLTEEISKTLYEILEATANKNGFSVEKVKVGEMDHVHCFVSAPPKISVSFIVKSLKGSSGYLLMNQFPELRKHLWKNKLWSGSYFVESIGSTSEENILKYIENQSEKPKCQNHQRK